MADLYTCGTGEEDTSVLWIKDSLPLSLSLSRVSRFRRWLFPGLTAAVILILIITVGASNVKMSSRLWSMEQSVSNLSDVVQSLNASLHAQAKEVQQLQFAVENNKDQLLSVSEALKRLSVVDSLSRTVDALKCSLERIINNSSVGSGCCPLGWELSENNCYFFSTSSLSWNESRVWCDQHGAHLVILLTDKQWDFVTRRTVPAFFWVGLSDWRTGRWEWINQSPYRMERRRWEPGQPDNWALHGLGPGAEDCGHLHSRGRLNDAYCSTKMRYVCQKHSMQM